MSCQVFWPPDFGWISVRLQFLYSKDTSAPSFCFGGGRGVNCTFSNILPCFLLECIGPQCWDVSIKTFMFLDPLEDFTWFPGWLSQSVFLTMPASIVTANHLKNPTSSHVKNSSGCTWHVGTTRGVFFPEKITTTRIHSPKIRLLGIVIPGHPWIFRSRRDVVLMSWPRSFHWTISDE